MEVSKYFLALSEASYLLNSQKYDPSKFYLILALSLVTKMLKFAHTPFLTAFFDLNPPPKSVHLGGGFAFFELDSVLLVIHQ